MRRRQFLSTVGGAAAWPFIVRAQQPAKMKRVAFANPSMKVGEMRIGGDSTYAALFVELERLGFVEGKNLIIDRYSAEGQRERYGDLAREVVSTHPDCIGSAGSLLTREFKAATDTIPVVAFTGDPVRFGLISSLAHPGGNITGVSVDAGLEIWGKRLELLVEVVPKISRVAFISTPGAWENPGGKSVQEVARSMGILVRNAPVVGTVRDEAEYRRVFSSIQQDQVDGIVFAEETEIYAFRFLAVQLVEQAVFLRFMSIVIKQRQVA